MTDTLSVYEENLLLLTISASVFFAVSLPIYSVGIYKLWKLQFHHLIQKRFPIISITIISASFLTATINTILRWVHYITSNHKGPEISSGCIYFVYGLINLRLTLIYLRWKHNQIIFKQYSNEFIELSMSFSASTPASNKSVSDTSNYKDQEIPVITQRGIYYHWFCILLLVITIIVAIFITLSDPQAIIYSMVMGTGWMIQIIITIVFVLIIVCKKVSEGIGCIKETVIMLCFQLIIVFMAPLMFISQQMILPMMIIFNLAAYAQGLTPLSVPLYYIYKMKKKNEVQISVNTDCSLFEFLNKYDNYQLFKKYLSHCWALESLLFYERVSIIYEILLRLNNDSQINESSKKGSDVIDHDEDVSQKNKFEYLTSIYSEYNKAINKSKEKVEFINVRDAIFKIFQHVCDEFIATGSVHQINISFKVKTGVVYLLNDDKSAEKFASFDDFLGLFDDAMDEIKQLMVAMYHYEFKKFIANKND